MSAESSPQALAPVRASHPGGEASLRSGEHAGRRALELRRRADASLERSRKFRLLYREPLFVVPVLMGAAYFLGLV